MDCIIAKNYFTADCIKKDAEEFLAEYGFIPTTRTYLGENDFWVDHWYDPGFTSKRTVYLKTLNPEIIRIWSNELLPHLTLKWG